MHVGMSSAEHIQERIEQKPTGSTLIQKLKSKRGNFNTRNHCYHYHYKF